MPATAYGELSQFESIKLAVKTRQVSGISVRKKRLGSGGNFNPPSRLQLLYIALTPDAKFAVRHLFLDDITTTNIDAKEKDLVLEARTTVPDGAKSHNELSRGFEGIEFKREAYFTIVIDELGWEFYFPAPAKPDDVIPGQTDDPVVFLDNKKVIVASNPSGTSIVVHDQDFAENHAFSDAMMVDVVVPGTGPGPGPFPDEARRGLRLINFFTDSKGQPLTTVTDFGFEIYLRAPAAAGDHLTTIIVDPDGQNQGPRT
jgi:hypothetical protein